MASEMTKRLTASKAQKVEVYDFIDIANCTDDIFSSLPKTSKRILRLQKANCYLELFGYQDDVLPASGSLHQKPYYYQELS